MPAIILGIRPGDRKLLDHQAKKFGRDVRELAGIYLEEAIRRVEADWLSHRPDSERQQAEAAR